MALLLPKQKGVQRQANFSGQPATTWGTVLTSDAVSNTEPATETEIFASTSFDTDWVNIWFHTNVLAATDSDALVNIKTGAAGSEVSLIPNMLAGWAPVIPPGTVSGAPNPKFYSFPLYIPAGTRISATHRSVRTSIGCNVMIELLGGGRSNHWTGTEVEAIGADTANSSGTMLTHGTAAEGTITSLGTTVNEWGFVQPMMGGNVDVTMLSGMIAMDLCSSGTVVIPGLEDFLFSSCTSEAGSNWSGGRFCYVPAGTTLNARTRGSAAAEAQAVVCYGVS